MTTGARRILSTRSGRVLVLALTSLVVIVATLGALEGAARIALWKRYGRPGKSYGIFQRDAEIGFVHRPNSYSSVAGINGLGLRNQEEVFEPRPANGVRILVFGGSTTFGYNLEDADTYTHRLEELLRAIPGLERSQVLNAGVICYAAGHNDRLLKRLVPILRPDAVVMYEGVNEGLNAFMLQSEGTRVSELKDHYGLIAHNYVQEQWLMSHSAAWHILYYYAITARHARPPDGEVPAAAVDTADHDAPWVADNFRYLLRDMLSYAQSQHVPAIFVKYPTAQDGGPRRYADIGAVVAREMGAPVSDVAARFARTPPSADPLFIHTGVHVTATGARLVADELLQTLKTVLPQVR